MPRSHERARAEQCPPCARIARWGLRPRRFLAFHRSFFFPSHRKPSSLPIFLLSALSSPSAARIANNVNQTSRRAAARRLPIERNERDGLGSMHSAPACRARAEKPTRAQIAWRDLTARESESRPAMEWGSMTSPRGCAELHLARDWTSPKRCPKLRLSANAWSHDG